MADELKRILDLALKYGPEVSQYRSGQKRISDQIERERRADMPELQRMRATPDFQSLLNYSNRDIAAPGTEKLQADFEGAKQVAGGTKGGLRTLASLLRAKGAGEASLLQASDTAKRAIAAQTAPLSQSIQQYNIGVEDMGALYDFYRDQRIGALEDQSQRMKGRGASTLLDILGDSRGLFAKTEENDGNGDGKDDNTKKGESKAEEGESKDKEDPTNNYANTMAAGQMNLDPSMYSGLLLRVLEDENKRRKELQRNLGIFKFLGGNI